MLSSREGQTQGQGQQESLQQQVGDKCCCNTWQHQEAGGAIFPLGNALDLFPWSITLVVTEYGGIFVPQAGHTVLPISPACSQGRRGATTHSPSTASQLIIPISLAKDLWGMVLFQGLESTTQESFPGLGS